MTRRQTWSFRVGCGLWILTGALQTAGHYAGWPDPATEEEATLFELFQQHPLDVGGVSRTLAAMFEGLSLSFAVLMFLLGFLGLIWLRPPGVPAGILRRVAWMNAVAALALVLLGLRRFPIAPLICFAAVGIAFLLAAARAPGTAPTAGSAPDRA